MNIDPYILAFSAFTVAATIWMGFRSAKKSKTASDFFVAGRSVSVGWNASAISGEYLGAASFMGIAGMVMSSGYDALWYPACYACGYLFLLLFIAGPLRRFGAYTIPDFAEGRFDSPVFRKIAVVFVLFIGFYFTMPQMKGAGTTLAYIFPGLPYWAGVLIVGAVITLNVALGGMKGITLVQAFQYWAKMFAISVPIFVLMAVYGHYGKQLEVNGHRELKTDSSRLPSGSVVFLKVEPSELPKINSIPSAAHWYAIRKAQFEKRYQPSTNATMTVYGALSHISTYTRDSFLVATNIQASKINVTFTNALNEFEFHEVLKSAMRSNRLVFVSAPHGTTQVVSIDDTTPALPAVSRHALPPKAPDDSTWLNPFGPLTTKAAKNAAAAIGRQASTNLNTSKYHDWRLVYTPPTNRAPVSAWKQLLLAVTPQRWERKITLDQTTRWGIGSITGTAGGKGTMLAASLIHTYGVATCKKVFVTGISRGEINSWWFPYPTNHVAGSEMLSVIRETLRTNGITLVSETKTEVWFATTNAPLRPLVTKAAVGKNAAGKSPGIPLRSDITPDQHLTVALDSPTVAQALAVYAELTGRKLLPNTNSMAERVDDLLNGKLSKLKLITRGATPDSGVRFHHDGMFSAGEVKATIEAQLRTNGLAVVAVGEKAFRVERAPGILPGFGVAQTSAAGSSLAPARQDAGGTLEKAWLAKHEKPLALLYTYSLIIAIVCGTAGLPHILVRFYTNPDGAAAKRTTMWVMILIGVFYVFPPVFGVLGRNLLPDLYAGIGANGTDKIVLELPRILNAKYPPLGSILSGITCAGAFAAFMSTFSGLLVSMTGSLAHDVYGRMLRPKSTPEQRMRMFKIGAVILGGVAIVLGSFVEKLEINFMVGQAFAIVASSYFPLLFMAVWWRNLTMKGAAAGMLGGGSLAMVAILLTSLSTLAAGTDKTAQVFAMFNPLNALWAEHPLARILCEQPAIWAVPLAITLMIVVSKLTAKSIPSDIRMKMLVLHAPEQFGLKQEYIQEQQTGH